jgi:hypothetical protein
MRSLFLIIATSLGLLVMPSAQAQTPDDEAAVRAVIADWYERVGQTPAKTPWVLIAPGGHDAGPGYSVPADLHSGSAAIRGPYLNHELAARAMVFSYDIDQLIVEDHFAKARVWGRGYFYASAAQKTYENAASALFVLEKRDGKWLILVHEASSRGIPPNKITDPMPDLRAMYYERCGNACDPAADAKKAAEW